jgi:hypothetical protein
MRSDRLSYRALAKSERKYTAITFYLTTLRVL